MTLATEPGWFGYFTRAEVPGGWPNGSRVVKRGSEPGDAHADGTLGTVIGSIAAPGALGVALYFVEWAPRGTPRRAVGTLASKLALYTGD